MLALRRLGSMSTSVVCVCHGGDWLTNKAVDCRRLWARAKTTSSSCWTTTCVRRAARRSCQWRHRRWRRRRPSLRVVVDIRLHRLTYGTFASLVTERRATVTAQWRRLWHGAVSFRTVATSRRTRLQLFFSLCSSAVAKDQQIWWVDWVSFRPSSSLCVDFHLNYFFSSHVKSDFDETWHEWYVGNWYSYRADFQYILH